MKFGPIIKNLWLSLQVRGIAAVALVWCICVTVLGLFGKSALAWIAFFLLNAAGAFIVVGLAYGPGSKGKERYKKNKWDKDD